MPLPAWVLPAVTTGLGAAGNLLGSRAQTGAISQAQGINQQATDDAIRSILALYDQGRSDLSPYRQVGVPALNNLQALANRGRSLPPMVQAPPQGNALANISRGGFGGGGPVGNAIASGPNLLAEKSRMAIRNSTLGGLGGGAAAFGLGFALPKLASAVGPGTGALGALGGPIGLGLGMLGSYIGSQFGKHNPDKAAASRGIDEVSRQIWGSNDPNVPIEQRPLGSVAGDLVHGKITPQEAEQRADALLHEWVVAMRQAGVDEGIIQSSIKSQLGYLQPFNDLLRQKGLDHQLVAV